MTLEAITFWIHPALVGGLIAIAVWTIGMVGKEWRR